MAEAVDKVQKVGINTDNIIVDGYRLALGFHDSRDGRDVYVTDIQPVERKV